MLLGSKCWVGFCVFGVLVTFALLFLILVIKVKLQLSFYWIRLVVLFSFRTNDPCPCYFGSCQFGDAMQT